jgi:hypothetical protein
MRMKEIEEKTIAEYLHTCLMLKGYALKDRELNDIAEVVFDYLLHSGVIKFG